MENNNKRGRDNEGVDIELIIDDELKDLGSQQHREVDLVEVDQDGEQIKAPLRKRRLKSKVWDSFQILPVGPDKVVRCACLKCGAQYIAESGCGTGNLIRHLKNCKKRDTRDIGQMLIQKDLSVTHGYDSKRFRELLVSAMIMHDLPFHFVEFEWIRALLQYLYPQVDLITRNIAKADCLKMYQHEKIKVKSMLAIAPGRISLTSDLWSSLTSDGYMALTAHWIDHDWVLHKKVLSFSFMPPPHSGVALSDKIANLLAEWDIERKLFSVTLDNASSNDVSVEFLCTLLNMKGFLHANGEFFHLRCCCYILNLVVQVGLKNIDTSIEKIRDCVKYAKGSQQRKNKFKDCLKLVSLQSKRGLSQDVTTRWNSTYLMLDSALTYRLVFDQMETRDPSFKCCPSAEEWIKVEKVHSFLKVYYEATLTFSGTLYPTANLYFPTIFPYFYDLKEAMKDGCSDEYIREMALRMWEKFQKYWSSFSLILSIACVLDPRYKLEFVEYCYKLAYGSNSIEFMIVRNKLFSLFEEYRDKTSSCLKTTSFAKGGKDTTYNKFESRIFKDFDSLSSQSSDETKTQLETYLAEARYSRVQEFDVLSYWKANQHRYPELSQMARDLLAIPVLTVASESTFSVSGRVLDQHRSSLKSETAEAIICTRDWLFSNKSDDDKLLEDFREIIDDVIDISVDIKDGATGVCGPP